MKNLIILLFTFFAAFAFAQNSDDFHYQGWLVDEDGLAISNKEVLIYVSIAQFANGGTIYYSETHDLKTSGKGTFDVVIGRGTATSGDAADIPWLSGIPYIGIEYDLQNGQGIQSIGYQKFNVVPFCLYAKHTICQDGLPGNVGATGPTGPIGPIGPTAATGPIGAPGQDGTDGLPGLPILEMENIPPSVAQEGQIYMDSGNNREDGSPGFRYYDGSSWIDL